MRSNGTESAAPALNNLHESGPGTTEVSSPASLSRNGGLTATFRSLRHRNYRLYFFGQMISLVGTWMQTTVVVALAFELTHLSKWPSLIVASGVLPTFILGAWGGTLADRVAKRSLTFVTQAIFAALAFVLA